MQSEMFLGDTTNIDHAYIDNMGMIIGGSYRPKFIVGGEVDEKENVVVDFSSIKKAIKKIIDDQVYGWDHKLWWIEGYSQGEIDLMVDGRVSIKTPLVTVEGPRDIVKIIPRCDSCDDVSKAVALSLKSELTEKLNDIYPQTQIEMSVSLTTDLDLMPDMNSSAHLFRYVHGLRESTSWGCQNIGHGHLSYISAETSNKLQTDFLLAKIASSLDSKLFVWRDNIKNESFNPKLGYECSRGSMSMSIPSDTAIVLDTETTVEHLVDYVAHTWESQLIDAGVTRLFVSEGLSKGAVKKI